MKNLLKSIVFSASLLFVSISSATPIIYFDTTPEFGSVGDSISVELMWDGSVDSAYISAWDVDISFDSSILSFTGASFHFGVDSFGCVLFLSCDAALTAPGLLDIFEVSFDSIPDLIANQDAMSNTFSLATLTFDAIADGVSPLAFTGPFLTFGDEGGASMSPTLVNGLVCIGNPNCARVPDPSSLPLLLLVIGGLIATKARRKVS